jgi:hypothetical protein
MIAGGALAGSDNGGSGPLFVLIGMLLFFAGLLITPRSGRNMIAGGIVIGDGHFIELENADTRFADQVEAASIYAEQQARYQQQQQVSQQPAGYRQPQPAPPMQSHGQHEAW